MLTLEMIEAEFWGLEREQPIRTRLRRAVALVLQHCLEDGVDKVLFQLADEVRKTEDAVGLIHKLQTEIGELRTALAQAQAELKNTPVPVCTMRFSDSDPVWKWKTSCGDGFLLDVGRKLSWTTGAECPSCHKPLVVVNAK